MTKWREVINCPMRTAYQDHMTPAADRAAIFKDNLAASTRLSHTHAFFSPTNSSSKGHNYYESVMVSCLFDCDNDHFVTTDFHPNPWKFHFHISYVL